ncbi:MAG: response regulator transcription factor [Flavobacteriales bacterium]|jgi:DNA-binding NarL/FixJ family response regulator|nr:response regulator transcription factor [Flavobacteriales bacterium]
MAAGKPSITRLALLDDHKIVIDGLKLLLKDEANLIVAVESTNSDDFLAQLKIIEVDIVITDIILPNQKSGVEVSRYVKYHFPEIRILVLSMNEDAKVVHELIEDVKVEGFVSKAAGREELLRAIDTIKKGGMYYSKEAAGLMRFFSRVVNEQHKLRLSGRELDIVKCIERRLTNKKIAEELFISERTVETHRKNIYRKTGTKGEAALIDFLRNNGILGV